MLGFKKKGAPQVSPKDATSLSPGAPLQATKSGVKIQIPWRFIIPVFGFFLGGGAIFGVNNIFSAPASASALDTFKVEQGQQHAKIDENLKKQDEHAQKQDARIEDINKTVTSVQTTQQKDVARTEARRLTEKITNRTEREEAYDRLYELNLHRLQRGDDPCANVNCD